MKFKQIFLALFLAFATNFSFGQGVNPATFKVTSPAAGLSVPMTDAQGKAVRMPYETLKKDVTFDIISSNGTLFASGNACKGCMVMENGGTKITAVTDSNGVRYGLPVPIDTAGDYVRYRSGLMTTATAIANFLTKDKFEFDTAVFLTDMRALITTDINYEKTQREAADAALQTTVGEKLNSTDTVGNYFKYYQAPPDLSPYATNAAVNSSFALKSEIGQGSKNTYYVSRKWTGARGSANWTTQANAAIVGSSSFPFCDIWQARDSAVTALRAGRLETAIIRVLDGTYTFAEDTCSRTDIDYRIPVSDSAVMHYGNYISDSTSTRTSNLAFKNLFWLFEKNTYIKNYTMSKSILFREGFLFVSKAGTYTACDNFGCDGLNYESFYGQNAGNLRGQNGRDRPSDEVMLWGSNIQLNINDYISRRGHNNILTNSGVNGNITVTNRFYRCTGVTSFVSGDTFNRSITFRVKDYNVGSKWSNDSTFTVLTQSNSLYLFAIKNKIINTFIDNVNWNATDNFVVVGHFSLADASGWRNSKFNMTFGSLLQENPYKGTLNTAGAFILLNGSTRYNSGLTLRANNSDMQAPLVGTNSSFDSFRLNIDIKDAKFNSQNNSSLTSLYPFVFGKGGSDYVVTLTGKYAATGYAGLIFIPDGAGTYILNGDFSTLDDKPVITVGSGFTGKIILNGKFVNGKNVTSPTTSIISGTNTNIVVQSAIANTAVASTITTSGNTIQVNSAYKY